MTSDIQSPKSEVLFLKLGGSLITDKTRTAHARPRVIRRLAREVKSALEARPDLKLVLGHGSGSFGHVAAKKYGTREGVTDRSGWRGFAEVAAAAAQLNQLVTELFIAEGVPVIGLPPSASARCEDGRLIDLNMTSIMSALDHNLIPLVHGDVAFDAVRGATIVSTEDVFLYLAGRLLPAAILLAGEVAGVYTDATLTGKVIDAITPATVAQFAGALGGSHGADVTGGMAGKVHQMLQWLEVQPAGRVRIFSGARPGAVRALLIDPARRIGTELRHD